MWLVSHVDRQCSDTLHADLSTFCLRKLRDTNVVMLTTYMNGRCEYFRGIGDYNPRG